MRARLLIVVAGVLLVAMTFAFRFAVGLLVVTEGGGFYARRLLDRALAQSLARRGAP